MKRFSLSLIICLLIHFSVFSQGTVSGKILSADDKNPVPGATVSVKGQPGGTSSDAKGEFKLSVPANAILVISSIEYETLEIPLNGRTRIDVVLKTSVKSLEQVVIVGYGAVRKKDLTGSVSQVQSKEIDAFPTTNVVQALAGRTSGVQVTQNTGAPGGTLQVRIRGTNSIQGSNEPLYVVDGFPISGSNPTLLNSADVESVEILKDASATAIYGSRGANGVVLITTKRGKVGDVKVDYEGTYGTQQLRKKLKLMNSQEYGQFYNLQAQNDGLSPYFTTDQINAFPNYDWQSLIFHTAPMTTQNLTVSGGNEKTRFSVGGGLLGQQGIILGSNYNRYSIRANITTDVSKKFSLNYGGTMSSILSDRQNSGGGNRGGSLIAGALSAAPLINPFKDDGSLTDLRITPNSFINPIINPLAYVREQTDKEKTDQILANVAMTYKPIPDLSIKISGGIENDNSRFDGYTTTNFPGSQGSASVTVNETRSLLSENTITYNKLLGDHSINAVAGFTYQDFLNTSLGGSGIGYLSNVTETYNLGAASTPGIPSSSYSFATLLSYIGRVNYSYKSKYLATASFRADGSSRYSDGNKWGYFPSFALAWRLSEEKFIKGLTYISDLKLRGGWGSTGSQAIAPYSTLSILTPGRTVFNDALYNDFAPGTRLPGNLKWETTDQADLGIDAGFLGNKYHVTLDYYVKNTKDLLNTVQLPSGFGYTSTIQNIGKIQNKGLEASIDAKIIDKAFKWDIGANISFNRSKVISLASDKDILGGSIAITLINDNSNLLREGQPFGVFYGYVEDGYTSTGKIKYKDLDGSGSINALDKTIIGNPNPKYTFGFNSSMQFKGFELTMFWQGSQGNDIVNLSAVGNTLDYGFGLNMLSEVLYNNWTPTNTNSKYPVISRSNTYNFSNRFIEDGSYVRLKTIQLAYSVPLETLKIKGIRSLQVSLSGQNLLTFTKYSWWDPETNSQGGSNSIGQGIDQYSYPTAKTVTVGLRAGF